MIDVELFPRYLAHQLKTQLPATVVGKLVDTNKKRGTVTLQTDPETKLNVEVLLPEHEDINNFMMFKYYEVRGICRSGKEIQMRGFTCFGTDFDMTSYNQMLQFATKQFKAIFYP